MATFARRRRMLGASVLLLVAPVCVAADSCEPFRYHTIQTPAVVPEADSFLLAVQRENIAPSFLLGTFHSADPRVRERWEPVSLLFATGRIRLMFTERAADPPLGGAGDPRLLPAGESLRAQMERLGLGERFAAEAARHGSLGSAFDRLRPWVAAALIEQGPARVFPENIRILDDLLRRYAEVLSVPVQPLESLKSLSAKQDEVLGAGDQRALLAAALCNTEVSTRLVDELTSDYAANDPAAFYHTMASLGGADPDLERRVMSGLVEARTDNFWQRLEPELAKGGVLVAVGNLHLLGKGGLAKRLAEAGFTTTALEPERLRVSLDPEQVPGLTGWVTNWLASDDGSSQADFTGVRIEPRSIVTLRRRLCPGQRCRTDGTYIAAEQRIILTTGIYAQLLVGGAAPRAEFRDGALVLSGRRAPHTEDEAVAYAESILVRELVRHVLHRAGTAEPAEESSIHCRANRILHRASLAQDAYLRHRGSRVRAHVFALDARCDH
ncbi:MAG: TraB/GumN family protein [Candidatus Thiodiazotropha sp.]